MWSICSAVSVLKYAITLIYELEKKRRINNLCIGCIHVFLLWNLGASHHFSVNMLFSVEEIIL